MTDIEKLISDLKETGFDHKGLIEIISENRKPIPEDEQKEGCDN